EAAHGEARRDQTGRHGAAHGAEADESDGLAHHLLLVVRRAATPRLPAAAPGRMTRTAAATQRQAGRRNMGDRLGGRKILVTAAAQGMGRAIALACAREGAAVVATDVNDAVLAEIAGTP